MPVSAEVTGITRDFFWQGEAEAKAGSPSERTDHWVVAGSEEGARRLIKERHPTEEVASIEQVSSILRDF